MCFNKPNPNVLKKNPNFIVKLQNISILSPDLVILLYELRLSTTHITACSEQAIILTFFSLTFRYFVLFYTENSSPTCWNTPVFYEQVFKIMEHMCWPHLDILEFVKTSGPAKSSPLLSFMSNYAVLPMITK